MRKIDYLERFSLDDGKSFRLQSHPNLPVPGGNAPYHFSGEERIPVLVGTGSVNIKRLAGGIVNAHASQGSHHHIALG